MDKTTPIEKRTSGKCREDKRRRMVIFGEEVLEKEVGVSSRSGQLYLPKRWVGKRVKVIKVG